MKNSNLNPGCIFGINGFRVLLHTPVDFPFMMSYQYYAIPFQKETNIMIKPQMIYPSKRIRAYSPDNRQCYFEGEKKLQFFKIYSKSNCELECKTRFILKSCGCVKFSMPRDNQTTICGNSQIQCIHQAEMNYYIHDLQSKLFAKKSKRDKKQGKKMINNSKSKKAKKMIDCKCLHSCTSMRYDVEITQTHYEATEEE
jgi:acid-sensing ion channel, other